MKSGFRLVARDLLGRLVIPLGGDMFLLYSGTEFRAPLSHNADLDTYKEHCAWKPESFMIRGGFVTRYVDYRPGAAPLWHRTAR
ncbi:hypothetical protein GGR54DRAFT_637832 [Hypoxylon sp. NC1633]|nr:hypothetical protein GGR54DRAFT_637832 [Hypoxylon sp. NC1633]